MWPPFGYCLSCPISNLSFPLRPIRICLYTVSEWALLVLYVPLKLQNKQLRHFKIYVHLYRFQAPMHPCTHIYLCILSSKRVTKLFKYRRPETKSLERKNIRKILLRSELFELSEQTEARELSVCLCGRMGTEYMTTYGLLPSAAPVYTTPPPCSAVHCTPFRIPAPVPPAM